MAFMTGWLKDWAATGLKIVMAPQEQSGSFYPHKQTFVVFVNKIWDLIWHNSQIVPCTVKMMVRRSSVTVRVRKEQQHSQQQGIRDSRKMMSSEQTKVFGQSPNKQHLPNSSAFSILLPHSSPNTGEKKLFFPSTRTAPHYLTAGIRQEWPSVARGSGKIRLLTDKTSKSRSMQTKPEDGTAKKIRFQIFCHDRAWFLFSFMSRRHPSSWQAPAGPVLPTSFCLPPQTLERHHTQTLGKRTERGDSWEAFSRLFFNLAGLVCFEEPWHRGSGCTLLSVTPSFDAEELSCWCS